MEAIRNTIHIHRGNLVPDKFNVQCYSISGNSRCINKQYTWNYSYLVYCYWFLKFSTIKLYSTYYGLAVRRTSTLTRNSLSSRDVHATSAVQCSENAFINVYGFVALWSWQCQYVLTELVVLSVVFLVTPRPAGCSAVRTYDGSRLPGKFQLSSDLCISVVIGNSLRTVTTT